MNRYRLGLIVGVLAVLLSAGAASAEKKPGKLIVPQMIKAGQKGFVPPKIWLYDEVGQPVASDKSQGAWDVGEYISLPEGWYQVELGNVRNKRNRAKLYVKSKRTTVVPTGIIAVVVEPMDQQPKDVCNRWSGQLYVSLALDPKPGPIVATNRDAAPHRVGLVQVVAGYYRIQWNRFFVAADVKPGHLFTLPTGLVGPMPQKKYTLHAKKGHAADNPGLRLCAHRPTRILARSYWGTYNKQITQFPFKQRVWEQIAIELPEGADKAYRKNKPVKAVRGPILKGGKSEPQLLWEMDPPDEPEPIKVPGEPAPKEKRGGTKEDDAGKTNPRTRGLPTPPTELTPTPSP